MQIYYFFLVMRINRRFFLTHNILLSKISPKCFLCDCSNTQTCCHPKIREAAKLAEGHALKSV